jgi:hypothetical protein
MAFLHNHLARKILLSIILAWGTMSFYLVNKDTLVLIYLILIIALFGLFYIWKEKSAIVSLILLSFTSAYAFNVFMFQIKIPFWLIMIGVLLVFGYLFTYTEQKIGILGNKRLIYLVLFSLIILEVFLALSYFVISPTNQSLIIAAISYLFVGFCYTVLAKHVDNNFITYIIITALAISLVFLTSTWGGLV